MPIFRRTRYNNYMFTINFCLNMFRASLCPKKTPDDGQRNCPKHVEFYSKNKFEKLVHLVGYIERVTKTIYKWKPYATRPKGRPRVRWEDDVRNDLRKMGVNNWKQMTQERKERKEIIEQAKTHKDL
jgi:hypothetical protein